MKTTSITFEKNSKENSLGTNTQITWKYGDFLPLSFEHAGIAIQTRCRGITDSQSHQIMVMCPLASQSKMASKPLKLHGIKIDIRYIRKTTRLECILLCQNAIKTDLEGVQLGSHFGVKGSQSRNFIEYPNKVKNMMGLLLSLERDRWDTGLTQGYLLSLTAPNSLLLVHI